MGQLDGKVAVVTGASSGIGAATAIRLGAEGAKVVLGSRRTDMLNDVAEKIRQHGGEAIVVTCDVTDEKDIEKLIKMAVDTYGGLHIAVNSAGALGPKKTVAEFDSEAYDVVFNTNVRATFFLLKHEIPAMKTTGPGGSIINVSSVLGSVVMTKVPCRAVYAASKAAIDMITKMAAIENPTLRVNSVGPGIVTTELTSHISPELAAHRQFIGRPGKVEEIANLVAFLASDEASLITGSVYLIDGGFSLTGCPVEG